MQAAETPLYGGLFGSGAGGAVRRDKKNAASERSDAALQCSEQKNYALPGIAITLSAGALATKVLRVEIFWPVTGKTQVIEGLEANRAYAVREGEATATEVTTGSFAWPAGEAAGHQHHQHHAH